MLLCAPRPSLAQSPGPVAAYNFNEGTGTTANDLSGNNLTGIIVGATWTTGGRYGNALSFNGTNAYVDLGNPAALRLTGSMTLEAWVNAAANPADDGQIIAKSSGIGWQLKTTPDTGPQTFGAKVSPNSTTSTQRYSTTVRSLNTWYHVAAVYNATTSTFDIYVNGVLNDGTLKGTIPSAQFDQSANVNIGRRTGGFYFNGLIDEVRIYNRALSASEIQTDMNTPIGGTPPPPDTIPPTVSISSPADGATVAGITSVTAAASDNVGVAGVQFLLDNANLGSEVTAAPYTMQWNAATASIGPHVLAAIARDFSGNTMRSTSVSVTVSNTTAAQVGQWSAVNTWPIVAVHAMLLPSGDVLSWSDYTNSGGVQVWSPANNTFTPKPETVISLFCSGHAYMADGRILITGGIQNATDDLGPQNATIFDPSTQTWSQGSLMATGRYYPTATTLPDGRILVQGGTTTCSTCVADMPEIYDPIANTWTQLAATARMAFKYYPHSFVLPDGRILVSGEDDQAISSRILDLNTQTWTTVDARVFDGHSAAMYLPGKIVKAGTATADNEGLPSAATTYTLDMTQPSPAWQTTAPMAFPRSYLNLTILPDGQVLATGGSATTDKANFAAAVFPAELWSPATKTWTTMSSMQTPRLYHSTALLLPDARVLVAGGGRHNIVHGPNPVVDPQDEANAEIFSPPYLFKGPRPVISSAPSIIQYGASFTVSSPDAARIASVSLIALGAVTHAFNENQHFIPLSFGQSTGSLNVLAPPDGNTAPPGPYMLFLVDTTGIPSVAAMLRLPVSNTGSTAPNIATLTPASGVAGASVTIAGTNFGNTQNTSTVTFNGLSAGVASAWSAASITVQVPVNVASGSVVVTVGGVPSNGVFFTVPLPPPNVSSINPISGNAGTSVTITGTNFGPAQNSSSVTFNGASAGVATAWSATSITVQVPGNATSGNVVVTVAAAPSNGINFTVIPPVGGSLALVQHASKDAGTATASTLAFPANNTAGNWIGVVLRAGQTGEVFTVTDTRGNLYKQAVQLNETVDSTSVAIYYAENVAPGPNTISVSDNKSGTLRLAIFEYSGVAQANSLDVAATAQGTSAAPATASMTTTVSGDLLLAAMSTANGANFTAGAGYTIREIVPAEPNTKLIVEDRTQPAAGATLANATLGASDTWAAVAAAFKVGNGGAGSTAPNIASLAPASGLPGSAVTITGTNFGDTQGTSSVAFNGIAAAAASLWSATSITVQVPGNAASGNIVVTVGGVASNGSFFTVTLPPPTITSINPTSGLTGSSVTITGTNFGAAQNTSTVTFNTAVATTVTAWSSTSITTQVPGNATSGNVVVTVAGVPSNGTNFTVTPPAGGSLALVQHTSKDAAISTAATLAFPANNTAGNWIGVILRAGQTGEVFTVTDTRGNIFKKAVQLNETVDGTTLAIYYAENIAGGANTVSVSDTKSGTLRLAILEYSGLAQTNSLDVSATAQGTGAAPATPSMTTTANGDLLLAAMSTANAANFTAGAGYTTRESVPAEPNTKFLVEDRTQPAAGATTANATLGASDIWGAIAVAFKLAATP